MTEQRASALGIASKGGKITWSLLAGEHGHPPEMLARGGCSRIDELPASTSLVGNPLAAAGAIGVGCTSMNPALAKLAGGTPVLHIDPLEAYLLSPLASQTPPPLPYLALVASTRFTALVLVSKPGQYHIVGRTHDISAGAALDKLAWRLGMDVPGGGALERLADFGDPTACAMPGPEPGLALTDFAFAQLETAALQRALELEGGPCEQPRADLAASLQAAVVSQLVSRTAAALRQTGAKTLVLAGGVTRNAALQQALKNAGMPVQATVTLPRSQRVAAAVLLRQLFSPAAAASTAAH